MYNPTATYRIQFHKGYPFDVFEKTLDYFKELGVSTIYASPIFAAVPGSGHGYDVINPLLINPELGSEEAFRRISKKRQGLSLGWIQDIVPNHMAFDPRNPWIEDVLEKGPQSEFASFFDITWNNAVYEGRLMVPVLGQSPEEAIQKRELKLSYENNRFVLKYYDAAYPVHPRTYETILRASGGAQAILQLLQQMEGIHQTEDKKAFAAQWHEFLLQLAGIMKNKIVRRYIDETLQELADKPERLLAIVQDQSYRLCHWRETDGQINYRRFFTVNGLICLNIQNVDVLQSHHETIFSLVDEGLFQGLRIDHIDGLYDPLAYLTALRQRTGSQTYVLVEKILGPQEFLPAAWPVQGNTGYDFLALVNNLLTYAKSEEVLTEFYYTLVREHRSIPQQVREKKAYLLYHHMGGELENLYRLLLESDLVTTADYAAFRTEDIKTAIAEFLVHCPVYRYYANALPFRPEEAEALQAVFSAARSSRPDLGGAFDLLQAVWFQRAEAGDEAYNSRALHFFRRCMQISGPLMAKGVEDTLMYTYNRFIGHNEVGDAPDAFGISPTAFHQVMAERQKRWPYSLNATSTHDTKRGEDVRARLNVITELSDDWLKAVRKWQKENAALKQNGAPDANDEYFIYQTLAGTFPLTAEEEKDYPERLGEYLRKALREAKTHSDWIAPDETYEGAAIRFAHHLLDKNKVFWKSFRPFLQKISDFGIINALVQTLLKFTCPGVPDVYQGCELWDLSFVDPDNRRPVDFEQRLERLKALGEKEQAADFRQSLWQERSDGSIKLWLTRILFRLRQKEPELFTAGAYLPLATTGVYREHVFAFARQAGRRCYVIALPLHVAALSERQGRSWPDLDWEDTQILLPDGMESEWEEVFTGEKQELVKQQQVRAIWKELPFALLRGKAEKNARGAGVLLHITSLPSPFGIGDLGPASYAFADFLARSHQKYWQLLPLNPVEEGQGNSPYSSISSRAGNFLLISPEWLEKTGLLSPHDLSSCYLPQEGRADYQEAGRIKNELLGTAYRNFREGPSGSLREEYRQFKKKEKSWLEDFALYVLLKEKNEGRPWYEWEDRYKDREATALQALREGEMEEMEKIKWIQFIFFKQWQELKAYCNSLDIELIGDLPIYVSYDSTDVWSHRDLFALDPNGERTGIAGVPPDAFSEDGQLWGMPVYRWDILKDQDYAWWIDRLEKNRELFDLVRLDHFRAFAEYWEVPAGETTARQGVWKTGPGAHFFETVKARFGELPFVAEDLGDINEDVTALRDTFALAGMKVLQFAFDENMPRSDYIPHNYGKNFIVYTGTHDNNTSRGWYRKDISNETRTRLQQYAAAPLGEEEVSDALCRMAYASVANTVILPLQDILGLDETARMNVPASLQHNWAWRLLPGQITTAAGDKLREWTWLFNRE
jgi:malto-oligosyltrehalose synthase/4-alpha-glucanotransferase